MLLYSAFGESRVCFCQAYRAAPALMQLCSHRPAHDCRDASEVFKRCGGRAWNASHLIARTTPRLSSRALFHKQTGFCLLALGVYILLRIRAERSERNTRHRLAWQMERGSRRGSPLSESGKNRQCSLVRKRANRDMVNYRGNAQCGPQCCVCIYVKHFPRCLTCKYLGLVVETMGFLMADAATNIYSRLAHNNACVFIALNTFMVCSHLACLVWLLCLCGPFG